MHIETGCECARSSLNRSAASSIRSPPRGISPLGGKHRRFPHHRCGSARARERHSVSQIGVSVADEKAHVEAEGEEAGSQQVTQSRQVGNGEVVGVHPSAPHPVDHPVRQVQQDHHLQGNQQRSVNKGPPSLYLLRFPYPTHVFRFFFSLKKDQSGPIAHFWAAVVLDWDLSRTMLTVEWLTKTWGVLLGCVMKNETNTRPRFDLRYTIHFDWSSSQWRNAFTEEQSDFQIGRHSQKKQSYHQSKLLAWVKIGILTSRFQPNKNRTYWNQNVWFEFRFNAFFFFMTFIWIPNVVWKPWLFDFDMSQKLKLKLQLLRMSS